MMDTLNPQCLESPAQGRTILLIEDNDDDIFIMRTIFRKLGITTRLEVVRNGEEAIAYLTGEGPYGDRSQFPVPSIMLIDLNMPRMNGFEFLKWLRQQPKLNRIVAEVLTASSRPGDVERAFDAGANGYFVKPSRMEELTDMINCWHRLACFRVFPLLT